MSVTNNRVNEPAVRIAMWSGPRNISTAMMRSWGNRPDTFVCDEPFYAHYLQVTQYDHPGAEEVISHGETDWPKVVEWVTGQVPQGKQIFYQKQMAHHLLPHIDRSWLGKVTNCFLIRNPQEVITSYIKKNGDPVAEDLGFMQQVEIFDWVRAHSDTLPPVLDTHDILQNPQRMLNLLCDALGVKLTDAMLSWPPGLRETDGIWAKHWYAEVETSTSFRPYQAKPDVVPERLQGVYEQCLVHYQHLYEHRLQ